MKLLKMLAFATVVGCGSVFLSQGCTDTEMALRSSSVTPKLEPPVAIMPQVVVPKVPLRELARRATFLIASKQENFGGSAFLVARKKIKEGYEYRAITAYHVIDEADEKMMKDGIESLGDLECVFQPNFHGLPLRFKTRFIAIDWTSPMEDWGSFKFVSKHKLDCAVLATRKEFLSLKPCTQLRIIGCAGGLTVICRQGSLASTHSEGLNVARQMRHSRNQWGKAPHKFFRFTGGAWYGDSGGLILAPSGKVIGIINGYAVMHRKWGPVNFIGESFKTYLIVELTKHEADFFKVEE